MRQGRRFQSSTAAIIATNISSNHLDLDFVLNLLDHSSSSSNPSANGTSNWAPKMKFKVIEETRNEERESFKIKGGGGGVECINEKIKRNDFSNLFNNLRDVDSSSASTDTTSISTFNRLQSLADSLPTQIYDRNGNLIPLNTSQPPMNFFDLNTKTSSINATTNQAVTLPIFQRENVDWSKISLTSILKKIVPEEVFKPVLSDENENVDMNIAINTNTNTSTSPALAPFNVNTQSDILEPPQFTQSELKLLDKDQLRSLAKFLNIPCDQTDYRIEHAILSTHKPKSKSKERKNSTNISVSKDKIAWTEENETLLMKLYEELRLEKNKVDQKLQSIVSSHSQSNSVPNVPSLKRGNGASDRGLWAVLGDRMRLESKVHVSVTECRNKLIILKRLKAT